MRPLLTFSVLVFSLTMNPGAHSTALCPLCLAGLEASWVGLRICLMDGWMEVITEVQQRPEASLEEAKEVPETTGFGQRREG